MIMTQAIAITGLPEIWDEYVSEFYPEKYREFENET